MLLNPNVLEDFYQVARLAGVGLGKSDIIIEELPAPHKAPERLPNGKMAIYIFQYRDKTLKVGKVGPNSRARYTSQHYNFKSSQSNLAASLLKGYETLGLSKMSEENVAQWIKTHTHRTNLLLETRLGVPTLNLLEAFLHCRLEPVFEGFASQK